MKRSSWKEKLLWTAAAAGGVYWLWQREQQKLAATPPMSADQAFRVLSRAAEFVRLPSARDLVPEVLPDGSGLRCPKTGRTYPLRDNVLHLLPAELPLSGVQQSLNTPFTSWLYDRVRDLVMPLFGLPEFEAEAGQIQQHLQVRPGDVVLDLCCGPGNFTAEWAKRAGPEGLVLGLDLSRSMLARAAHRVQGAALTNVLLVRADAQQLPLADACLAQVNCSGGFHQLPDLERALREISRVSRPRAVLTASTFALGPDDPWTEVKQWLREATGLHFVSLTWLGEHLATLGYREYQQRLPGLWFGYAWARRGGP